VETTNKHWLPTTITVVEFHRKSSHQPIIQNDRRQHIRKPTETTKKSESFWNGSNSGIYAVAIVLSSIVAIYVYERRNKDSKRHPMNDNSSNGLPIYCKSIPDNDKVDKWTNDDDDDKHLQSGQISNKNSATFSSMNVIADIVEKASPSVACIEAFQKCASPFAPMSMMSVSSGSGFLVDDDGHDSAIILTNAHVIANCQQVVVRFNDDRRIQGQVEFIDERLDLATVRVPLSEVSHLKPIRLLDDSKKIRPGEWVIAVGAPFTLSNTV
ncbi:serine protease-like protein, partial [Euroglyphus maynei]